jgi:hypothetical protein
LSDAVHLHRLVLFVGLLGVEEPGAFDEGEDKGEPASRDAAATTAAPADDERGGVA